MSLTDEGRCKTYRRYLLTEKEALEDEALFKRESTVVGDKDFKSKLKNVMGRFIARKVGRPRPQINCII